MSRLRLFAEWWLIVIFTLALVAGLTLTRATEPVDNVLYDTLVGLRAPLPDNDIIIVTIDNQSLKALGKWPWSRSVHAGLLRRIGDARPVAIAYDVLFTEQSLPSDDQDLGEAVRMAASVSLPILIEVPGRDGNLVDLSLPIAPVRATTKNLGHVMLATDRDGTVRRVALDLRHGGRDWPHLMEMIYRDVRGHASPAWQRALTTEGELLAIPFQAKAGGFRMVSAASVYADEVPDAFFYKKIVLVGAMADGLGDQYRVAMPGGAVLSGVEIQANILNSLLSDRTVWSLPPPISITISYIAVLILMAGFWWMTPARGLALALLLIAIMLLAPSALLVWGGYWFPPTAALIGIVVAYPLWGWRRLHAVDRAIGDELSLFAPQRMVPDRPMDLASSGPQDRVGGHVAQLRQSIGRMRDLQQLLDDTIESILDPLVATSMSDCVLIANDPAIALLGNDVIGANFSTHLTRVTSIVDNDDQTSFVETKNGRVFSLRRSVLRDSEARQKGWIILLVDISHIRDAEREREAALEFLSHDMRSPQAAIISLLDQNENDLQPRTVEQIRNCAHRTLSLAENFVQLARLKAAPINSELVDLVDVMTEAIDQLWIHASNKRVKLITNYQYESHLVMAERYALSRSLINLLDNAVKHSPEGKDVHCWIRSDAERMAWLCVVEDEGEGVPDQLLPRLFGRFIAGASATPQSLSSGLGLAFVRATAERHGGSVNYEQRSPCGARFIISVPMAPEADLS
ncbi:MAG: CHASE2 domain-containing protein [Alphaproteobacteria bacterium]|nr:CHASE2 domain-containing protein [Alphaproteobacteria bacterium]MBU0876521.1 CHASE2 domain-containing protein [Alphaproteobacteria bacterium]MBU1770992.1 CHASE2 domain-containing protein [Alphaproteobacteria bacterium]